VHLTNLDLGAVSRAIQRFASGTAPLPASGAADVT
jgi:hypothetical protein